MCANSAWAGDVRIPARPFLAAGDILERVESGFDRWFGARANPLRHLGALGFYLFWIIVASGAYLYILFDTSVSGAYPSVQSITFDQPWLGGLIRSIHRYASDAFALVIVVHTVCEFVHGRYGGFRWFTWISGVPLVWLALTSGVVGYWLVWDALAQFSAVATMEWLDALGVFGVSLARNFLTPDSIDDRLFSLFVFLHIGLPLLLLLGMWIHVKRLSQPDTQPARALAWGTLAALVALSIAVPATSAAPADLTRVAAILALDWFYLAPHALMYETSETTLWLIAAGGTLLLALCPLLSHAPRAMTARVDAGNCNGCRRCFADCPYGAISMQPHPDGRIGAELAVVSPELCAGCGICAGACPSSTPFRSVRELVTGIDMLQLPVAVLRARLRDELEQLTAAARIVVFGCVHGADVEALRSVDTGVVLLLCAGQLPPAFVEYALRHGADGVVVAACPEDGCAYRLGARWTRERLLGEREPHLRARAARSAVRMVYCGRRDLRALQQALNGLRAQVPAAKRGNGGVHV